MFKWRNFKIAEWMPDQPPLNNPGANVVTNCIPAAGSFRPLSSTVTFSTATTTANDDYIRGAVSIRDYNDVVRTFCGDAKDLYELSATGWDIVSVTSGAYSGTATTEVWDFAQWGNTLIATNFNNVPQQLDLTSSTFNVMVGPTFNARFVETINDFVVFASLNNNPTSLIWSAFNNANDYTPSIRTQSDSQELFEGGWITGLVALTGQGREIGVIFQERSINLMIYEGPPRIFRFDRVHTRRGCRIPGSIVRYAHLIYYIGEDDFYVFDGKVSNPLGAEKVVRKFYNTLDRDYTERVSATVDTHRNLIIWSYPSLTSTQESYPDKLIIYSWITNSFTEADVQAESIFNYLTPGYSLDQLDTVSADLDALPYTLDSRLWKGGTLDIGAFNRSNQLFTFSGNPMDATVELTEIRSSPGHYHEITNIRPLVEGGTASARIGYRNGQDVSATYTTTATANSQGEINVRVNSRFSRVEIRATGTWQYIQGADIYMSERGTR